MTSSRTSHDANKGKVTLSGAQETLLLTLQARALDAESANPVLNDRLSAQIKRRIEEEHGYKFGARGITVSSSFMAKMVSARAKLLDQATAEFLRQHPGPATVLHLACGMDTRSHRIQWQGPGRLWIDVDKEDVVALRRAVVEAPVVGPAQQQGEYRLESPDIIHDPDWLADLRVPTDRPVLVLFEGLVMYLAPGEVLGLLRRILRHFEHDSACAGGRVHFDSVGPLGYFVVNYLAGQLLKRMGTRFSFYMANERWLEVNVPGLRFVTRSSQAEALVERAYPAVIKWLVWGVDYLVGGRLAGGVYGFEF